MPIATPNHPASEVAPALTVKREDLESMLLIRRFEERLLTLFQAGRLHGTTHTCIGQEAIPVAVMPLLREGDFIFSNHRGHGHYLARFGDPAGLLAEIMGREGGVCGGVGGSQHLRRGRYYSTGIQGESLPVAVGAALHLKREGGGGLAAAFIGDGTWGEGAVYEALNMAALWQVPLVVVVENNEIAQTTAREWNMAGTIEGRVRAFGIDFLHCPDGDVAALRASVAPVIERVRRERRPLVIEFATRRLGAHSKGDDTRSAEAVAELRQHDWFARAQMAAPDSLAEIDREVTARLDVLVREIEARPPAPWLAAPAASGTRGGIPSSPPFVPLAAGAASHGGERLAANLNRALHEMMERDPRVIFLGEDVLDPYGGAFKVARGLSTKFPDRVITTPLSELAIAGVGNGLALAGQRPVVEFMFGDFSLLAFDQIVNFAAKTVSMYGERLPHPVLFRCPVGGHRGYGATHSQSVQKHFLGVPDLGLYELSPLHDCTTLLPAIFERGNPAVLFESKTLYAQERFVGGRIDELFTFDLLDAWTARVFIGTTPQVLVITTGGMFHSCWKAARALFFEHEIEAEIVVPFRLYPFDAAPLAHLAVQAKAIYVVEESTAGGTWGAEVAATLAREVPGLRAPLRLIHSADSVIPSAPHLERAVLVQPQTIVERISRDFLHGSNPRSHDQ